MKASKMPCTTAKPSEAAPDATTLLKFRRLLEEH
jgi:hypothetical protein